MSCLTVISAASNARAVFVLVTDLPRENVIVVTAGTMRTGSSFPARSSRITGGIRLQCLEWIDHRWQLLVLHFDELGAVRCDIAVLGDDERNFLVLETDFSVRQHSLDIARLESASSEV